MSANFANFIDELRQARKMSREELVDDIISLRQYYRFQKGEYSLKSDILEQLLSRLDMPILTAYRYYYGEFNETNKKLEEVYPLIYNRKLKKASELLSKIDYTNLVYKSQKKLYKVLSNILDVELKKMSYDQASGKIIKIINYPKLLNNEILSFYEIIGLSFITKKVLQENDMRIAEISYDLITKREGKQKNFLNYANRLPFYIDTSRVLGHLKKYEESIAVAKISVEEIFNNGDIVMLIYFYMLMALGYKSLDNPIYRDYVRKTYMLLHIEGNPERKLEFSTKLQKVFLLTENDVIEYK